MTGSTTRASRKHMLITAAVRSIGLYYILRCSLIRSYSIHELLYLLDLFLFCFTLINQNGIQK